MIAEPPPVSLDSEFARAEGSSYVKVEGALWMALAVAVALSMLTANPLLTASSFLVLPILITLLWRRGEVPILLFAATFQWLQVSSKVFQANLLGVPVAIIGLTPTVERSIWMGLGAIVVLAIGMRTALRRAPAPRGAEAAIEAEFVTAGRAFVFYVLCTIASGIAWGLAWASPGLTQLLGGVAELKWAGFFILGYVVLSRREGFLLLAGATAFEFIQGIGFFSGFKIVIFVLAIVIFTVHSRLDGRTLGVGLAGLAGLLVLGAAWTSVKTEYRAFLNQGSRQQETVVSQEESVAKLVDLITALSWDDVTYAIQPLLSRVAYVDYFAVSMDYVPAVIPYERGAVWRDALQNLIPRLLYPDKPRLASDSEHTMRYTGLVLASGSEGTSISLGYVADSYVDFGPVWMYIPIFLVGLLWGLMYRYFLSKSPSAIVGFALATAALITAYQYEAAAVKLVAGVTVKFLVLAAILRFAGYWVTTWLGIDLEAVQEAVQEAVNGDSEEDAEASYA